MPVQTAAVSSDFLELVASATTRLPNATTSHRLLPMHRSHTSVHGCFVPECSTEPLTWSIERRYRLLIKGGGIV